MTTLYDFSAVRLDGTPQPLSDYAGTPLLVVNTASQCGFTPQYAGLQKLYEDYADRNFSILGFPCDQFGHQEPGDAEQIASFCSRNYGVTFPMFAKVDVNGAEAHPVFRFLRYARRGLLGTRIKWNFTKFLVNGDGEPVARFGSTTTPDRLRSKIEPLLS